MHEAANNGKNVTTIEEGMLLDYITGQPIKESVHEQMRQRIARALFHEYGISLADMETDFRLEIDGRRKRVDIAVFSHQAEHTCENIQRIVICRKQPKSSRKGVYQIRDHQQAQKELDVLHAAMTAAPNCRYGLWTNGMELFFCEKQTSTAEATFRPIGDWPALAVATDSSAATAGIGAAMGMRRADPEMLRATFRRCHNFVHGNEGMPKDAAFWQFLYLIFAKMHDEKRDRDHMPRFWAGPYEQFDPEGRQAIRARIEPLFEEVKGAHTSIFRGNEELTLSDRALAFLVAELGKYDLSRTDIDAKGVAYQELVGTNLRGDRGQYFTPGGVAKLMVEMLDPQPNERILDPACGTGGFLIATLDHLNAQDRERAGANTGAAAVSHRDRLAQIARSGLFGADFDPFLIRAAQMNAVMAANAEARLYNLNALEFPAGQLPGVADARQQAGLGTMDVVMTNPPFGSNIPITDPNILTGYDLAHVWERTADGGFRNAQRLHGSVAPEVLFIERCIDWLKPGGRMGIVLPDGILNNPGDEYIRWWILRRCWVLASVDLPVEVFIVEANVNILTSVLFLKKRSPQQIQAGSGDATQDYPVFMAVADKVGYDRRGNTLWERSPDGEEILVEEPETETISVGGRIVTRTFMRRKKVVDNDLPKIGVAYRAFRRECPEPGA